MPTTNGPPCAQPAIPFATPATPEQRSRAGPVTGEAPAQAPAVVLIAIHLLVSEDGTRLERNDAHLNGLAADFKQRMRDKPGEHPVTTPLRVIRRGEKYLIVAGNNRYFAGLRAGLRDMPCIALPGDLDEAALLIEQAKDNELRQGYSPLERVRNMVRLQQLRGCSQREACGLLGISVADGSRWLSVLKGYPEDLHSLLGEGDEKVPITVAYQLSRLKDEPKIRELTERIVQGFLNRDQIEGIVKPLLGGKKTKGVSKPIKAKTARGLHAIIPALDFDAVLAELKTLTDAVRKAQTHNLPLSSVPSLLKGT